MSSSRGSRERRVAEERNRKLVERTREVLAAREDDAPDKGEEQGSTADRTADDQDEGGEQAADGEDTADKSQQ